MEKFKKPESEDESSKSKRKRRRIAKDVVGQKDTSKNTSERQKRSKVTSASPSDDEVQKQIKETLEKLQTSKSKAAKYRKEKEIRIKKGLKRRSRLKLIKK